jgi:hypothetical protein
MHESVSILENTPGVVHGDLTPEQEERLIVRITTNPRKPEEVEKTRRRLIELRTKLRRPVTNIDLKTPDKNLRLFAKAYLDPEVAYPMRTLQRLAYAMRECAAASDTEKYYGVIEVSEQFVTIAELPWVFGSSIIGTRTKEDEVRDYFLLIPR